MRATHQDHARPWQSRRVRCTRMVPGYPAMAIAIYTATRRTRRTTYRWWQDATIRTRRAPMPRTNARSPGVQSARRRRCHGTVTAFANRSSPRDPRLAPPPPPCRLPPHSSPSIASWRRGRSATSLHPRAPPPSPHPWSRRRRRSIRSPAAPPRRCIRCNSSCITWRSPRRIFSVGNTPPSEDRRDSSFRLKICQRNRVV